MAERYDVVLDGQLGERRGTMTWTETDGLLTGTFTLFGIDNPVIGRRSGAVLELTHTLRTAVSLLRCCTHAELRGRELCGTITSGRSRIRFRGKKTDGKDRGMIYQQKVDFQAHYLPKVYYDFLEEEGLYCPDGFPAPEWDEAWQQEAMTELCIAYALLSISSPGVFTGNKFRSRELARKINEEGAQIVSHAPGNLGFLATLPLPLVHSSIFEARCCLDELHADGVGLMTNYGGVYLGDRRLDELMAELDGRGALAVMHPTQPAVMVPDVNEEIPVPVFEYFVETTRAFLNMAQNETFTTPNMLAFVIPAGDYEKEAALLTELESRGEIDHAVGLANTEAMDGCMLADKLTPRQFSELAGLDYEMAQVVYAAEQGDYGKLMGNIASYKVPIIDMFLFVCEQADAGIIQLDAEQMSMLSDAQTQMRSAKAQLQGSDYSRMLLYLTLPVSVDDTYAFIDTVRTLAQSYYPDGNVYVAGDSTNEYDFQKSFARDNTVVSIVSIRIVLVVLFTFLSAGMPVLLILVIQGGIRINFSIPAVLNQPLFFMSYLVVRLYPDGREYRLCHRHRQPLSGAQKHHVPPRRHDRDAELHLPDGHHLRHDSCRGRNAHRADDLRGRHRRHRSETRPRHDHLNAVRAVRSAADSAARRRTGG